MKILKANGDFIPSFLTMIYKIWHNLASIFPSSFIFCCSSLRFLYFSLISLFSAFGLSDLSSSLSGMLCLWIFVGLTPYLSFRSQLKCHLPRGVFPDHWTRNKMSHKSLLYNTILFYFIIALISIINVLVHLFICCHSVSFPSRREIQWEQSCTPQNP